jgi:hypothetical protein
VGWEPSGFTQPCNIVNPRLCAMRGQVVIIGYGIWIKRRLHHALSMHGYCHRAASTSKFRFRHLVELLEIEFFISLECEYFLNVLFEGRNRLKLYTGS